MAGIPTFTYNSIPGDRIYPITESSLYNSLQSSVEVKQMLMGAFALMVVVCAVTDRRNMEIHRSLYALYTGLTVAALGMAVGFNGDYPLNPARDFAPRVFLTMAGWGHEPFWYRMIYWLPVFAAHLGAMLGAVVYVFLVEMHLLDLEEMG